VIQGHAVPDGIEAAVTLEIGRQSKARYGNVRFYGLGTGLFGYLWLGQHVGWAVYAAALLLWLTVWNLFMLVMLSTKDARKEIEEQILAKAVSNRSRRTP
jgi:hypothetical protein